jgi:guanine deaminase
MNHVDYMKRAVELSRDKMRECEGGPFAAVVVMDGEIVGEGWNRVTCDNDPTAHAEVNAIRDACKRLGTFSLEGASMYTSCEPCPMCLSAIYWARISRVYYSNTTADAAAIGFDDEFLYAELVRSAEERSLPSERLHVPDALAVFAEWDAMPDKTEY